MQYNSEKCSDISGNRENHRSDYEKKELLRRTQFNRIVKGGRATLMNLEWDGYDLINMLTKHCEIHDG